VNQSTKVCALVIGFMLAVISVSAEEPSVNKKTLRERLDEARLNEALLLQLVKSIGC